ncbi:glycosyltransferase family 2 protein, partial [Campylobacter jejuni]
KRDVFEKLYPLPNSMCNYQDMKMHIDILNIGEIKILETQLIRYRRTRDKTNISSHNSITTTRENLETEMLLDTYLKFDNIFLLEQIFHKEV